MSETITTVGVQLSTHEIWSLMRLMRLPGIPGLPLPSHEILSEEALNVTGQLALASLRARGLIQIRNDGDSPTVIIDKTTGALLGASALCDYWLTLSVQSTVGAEKTTYIYFSPHLPVSHSQPQPNLHLFSAAVNGDILFSAIYDGLALDNVKSTDNPFSWVFDAQFLTQITEAPAEEIMHHLISMGIKMGDAQQLVVAIRSNKRLVSRQTMDTQAVTGIQILKGDIDYFLCTPHPNGIHFETVNTPQLIDVVMQLIR